jgi:hypothetical protein
MSDQANFVQDVVRNGQAATASIISGTTCPCMTSRDSTRPSYSAEWHRNNLSAADCLGTGKISRTTTTVNLKAYFFPVAAVGNSIPMTNFTKSVIGELDEKDLMLFGAVNTATNALYSLSAMVERKDTITYNGNTYLVRHVFQLTIGETVGEWALLKRTA